MKKRVVGIICASCGTSAKRKQPAIYCKRCAAERYAAQVLHHRQIKQKSLTRTPYEKGQLMVTRWGYEIPDWKQLADLIYFRGEEIGLDKNVKVVRACGISKKTYENIDNGLAKHITQRTARKIAKGLQLTTPEFIERAGLR
jgi:hypothetical protein